MACGNARLGAYTAGGEATLLSLEILNADAFVVHRAGAVSGAPLQARRCRVDRGLRTFAKPRDGSPGNYRVRFQLRSAVFVCQETALGWSENTTRRQPVKPGCARVAWLAAGLRLQPSATRCEPASCARSKRANTAVECHAFRGQSGVHRNGGGAAS